MPGGTISKFDWYEALSFALERLYTYTHARPPSRTLIDPLDAFIARFCDGDATRLRYKCSSEREPIFLSSVSDALTKANEAALATRDMDAKAGRSAYVDSEKLRELRVPDPGAWGVKTILEAIFKCS
jgi:triose/dihydroxyacetone kinase / FAD-AMP lyase (cyclizing)